MTDYLEELLEGAEILLEQVMQAEHRLSVGERGDSPLKGEYISQEKGRADNPEMLIGQTPDGVYKTGHGRVFGGAESIGGERAGQDLPAPTREREEQSVLLEELERMDQLSMEIGFGLISAGREPERNISPFAGTGSGPASSGGAGGLYSGGAVSSSSLETGAPAGEALDWAEQADRVFRRDSRRYDGGFRLY